MLKMMMPAIAALVIALAGLYGVAMYKFAPSEELPVIEKSQ